MRKWDKVSTSSSTMLACEDLTFVWFGQDSFFFLLMLHNSVSIKLLPCLTVEERWEKVQLFHFVYLSQCVFFCLTYNVHFCSFVLQIKFSTLLFLFLFYLPVLLFIYSVLQAHRPWGLFFHDLWDALCCPVFKPSHVFCFVLWIFNHCVVLLQRHLEEFASLHCRFWNMWIFSKSQNNFFSPLLTFI